MSIKNPNLFAGSIFGLVGGLILLVLAQRFEATALDTYIEPKFIEAVLLFLGFIITGLSLMSLVISFVMPPRN